MSDAPLTFGETPPRRRHLRETAGERAARIAAQQRAQRPLWAPEPVSDAPLTQAEWEGLAALGWLDSLAERDSPAGRLYTLRRQGRSAAEDEELTRTAGGWRLLLRGEGRP